MDKNLIKLIIKEEIDLTNNNVLVENLFKNKNFQKKFILDSIHNPKSVLRKLVDKYIGNEFYEEDSGKFGLDLTYRISYQHNDTPLVFNLILNAVNGVGFDANTITSYGDYYTPKSNETYITHIEWLDITPLVTDTDGNDLDFSIFDQIDNNTKELFIKSFTYSFIEQNSPSFKYKL